MSWAFMIPVSLGILSLRVEVTDGGIKNRKKEKQHLSTYN